MPHLPIARTLAGTAVLALLIASALVPAATAQIQNAQLGNFGTRVKVGDVDYLPLTKRASSAIRVMEWDAGIVGDVRDNCILLMMDNTDGGPARAVPGALPAAQVVYTKDIRMNPCDGKAIGTAVADADTEAIVGATLATTPFVETAVEVRYGDLNGNGKYDRADPLYLTTMTGAVRGLPASTGPGAWSIRLTPINGFQPGSFVVEGDSDFHAYRLIATGYAVAGGTPTARTWSLVEREGNGWYFIPAAPAGAPFSAAQQPIPVNSLRIGIVGLNSQQPLVNPSAIALPEAAPAAGATYKIAVKFSNDGTGSGAGLLVTKLDGTIVDARMTPILAPQEVGQAIIPVPLPAHGGRMLLQIGETKLNLDVEGPAASPTLSLEGAAPSTLALDARIAALEAQLAALQADDESPVDARASTNGIPSLAPSLVLAVLAAVLLVLRRRA